MCEVNGCFIVTLLLAVVSKGLCQYLRSPCPEVFEYRMNSNNELYGFIQVRNMGSNVLQLDIEMSLGNSVGAYKGKLTIANGHESTKFNGHSLIKYNVNFPPWQNIPPQMTKIVFNGKLLCAGRKVTFQEASIVTTVTLQHILRIDITPLISPSKGPQDGSQFLDGGSSTIFIDDGGSIISNPNFDSDIPLKPPKDSAPLRPPSNRPTSWKPPPPPPPPPENTAPWRQPPEERPSWRPPPKEPSGWRPPPPPPPENSSPPHWRPVSKEPPSWTSASRDQESKPNRRPGKYSQDGDGDGMFSSEVDYYTSNKRGKVSEIEEYDNYLPGSITSDHEEGKVLKRMKRYTTVYEYDTSEVPSQMYPTNPFFNSNGGGGTDATFHNMERRHSNLFNNNPSMTSSARYSSTSMVPFEMYPSNPFLNSNGGGGTATIHNMERHHSNVFSNNPSMTSSGTYSSASMYPTNPFLNSNGDSSTGRRFDGEAMHRPNNNQPVTSSGMYSSNSVPSSEMYPTNPFFSSNGGGGNARRFPNMERHHHKIFTNDQPMTSSGTYSNNPFFNSNSGSGNKVFEGTERHASLGFDIPTETDPSDSFFNNDEERGIVYIGRPKEKETRRTYNIQPDTSVQSDANESLDAVCGRPLSFNTLVVNGDDVPAGAFPWLGALFFIEGANPIYKCSSSLISHKHVVTAAHCVKIDGRVVSPKDLLIVLGKLNIKKWTGSDGEQNVDAKRIHVHPDYKPLTSDADIAVIVLAVNVEITNFVRPICLWKEDSSLRRIEGQSGTIVGWGKDETGALETAEPKQVSLPVVSQEECLRSSPGFRRITSNRTFCAGEKDGKGPCNGDSGSGFVMKRGRAWYLRGIVSISISDINTRTCDLSQYVAFTDAAKFTRWLLSFVQ